jgi:hypothetical protein
LENRLEFASQERIRAPDYLQLKFGLGIRDSGTAAKALGPTRNFLLFTASQLLEKATI